jgi:predicted nucleic acid-binding protein
MIVLDTNVLSETLKPLPNAAVVAWMAAQPRSTLFTTTVVEAEILYGVAVLADGARKTQLQAALKAIFTEDLSGQVIPFDRDCAEAYAAIAANRKNLGQPISQFDAMIAAATASRGATLATRNLRDFADCGIRLINPWET